MGLWCSASSSCGSFYGRGYTGGCFSGQGNWCSPWVNGCMNNFWCCPNCGAWWDCSSNLNCGWHCGCGCSFPWRGGCGGSGCC